ncbi:hypothetical protein Ciccas_002411 [Cichlidogyrus casuarinus]|uniref:Myotubularin-related protein 13 n=1 Tax=Cichlidogyrus casuarinus TaxID=1844966 RepID=A0ABD2QHA1_9PLAT
MRGSGLAANNSTVSRFMRRGNNGSIHDNLSASSFPFSANLIANARNMVSLYVLVDRSDKTALGKAEKITGLAFIPVETVSRSDMKKAFKALFSACIPDRVRSTGWASENDPSTNPSDAPTNQSPTTGPASSSGPIDITQAVHDSQWLQQIQNLLQTAGCVVDFVDLQGASVALCLEEGVDNVPQLSSLVQVMLDPFYRTIAGFWTLVQKEWLAFGHPFSNRASQTLDHKSRGFSPVFLQFLDATHQLVRQFPLAFEFNDFYLQFLAYHHVSNRFVDFKSDSQLDCLEHWFHVRSDFQDEYLHVPDERSLRKSLLQFTNHSIFPFIWAQHREWPVFFNFRYDCQLASAVLRPATRLAALDLWEYYTTEDLESGPIFDLDHFCPSFRRQNPREYEPIIRQGFNNSHIEQTYALLGLREGDECPDWSFVNMDLLQLDGFRAGVPALEDEMRVLRKSMDSLSVDSVDQISLDEVHREYLLFSEPGNSISIRQDPLSLNALCKSGALTHAPGYPSHQARAAALEEHKGASLELLRAGGFSHAQLAHLFAGKNFEASSGSEQDLAAINSQLAAPIARTPSDSSRSSSQFNLNISTLHNEPFGPISKQRSSAKLDDEAFFDELFITKHHMLPMSRLPQLSNRCFRCNNRRPELRCTGCNMMCHEKCYPLMEKNCGAYGTLQPEPISKLPVKSRKTSIAHRLGHITENDEQADLGPVISAPFDLQHRNGHSDLNRTLSGSQNCPNEIPNLQPLNVEASRPAATMAPIERGTLCSYLYKLSKNRMLSQQWHRRFFVLDSSRNQLQYFETRESQVLRGYIDIQDVQKIQILTSLLQTARLKFPAGCVLEISTTARSYKLASEDSNMIRNWHEKIRHQMS